MHYLATLKDLEALRVISIIENVQLYAAVAILQIHQVADNYRQNVKLSEPTECRY